ncbi:MAG: cisplatin damage response ATP-dependent DNA ligase, partial [Planctomycetota bacterium]
MRIGVSRTTVERAIAEMAGVEQSVIAHRLMGDREPTAGFFERLISTDDADVDAGRPYPFFLASPIVPPELPAGFDGTETDFVARELGDAADWLAEWKWDGIRAQLIKRAGGVFLWSRGDDNLTERLPELTEAAARLPDGSVLDGEVICWHGNGPEEDHPGGPMEFGVLQRRIGRTQIGPKILSAAPVAFLAYDALESDGADLRLSPLEERRNALASILTHAPARLHASPIIPFESWAQLAAERETSRARGVEGVMLKRRGSPYRSGRRRGDWWKWKIEPLTIDAVLVYAQPGHGRRAGVMTDYTFAVWDGSEPGEGRLVTVTKAYTGLTDEEFAEMDRWIRRHTKERFGPVRQVEPAHVFEIAFDSARLSGRHKSGVALRFPRMKRWRRDLGIDGADTLEAV